MQLRIKDIALMGLMLAITITLNAIESVFSPPPHFRLGLANIVVMYAVFTIGRTQAICLNVLKALFVGLSRGFFAGLLSLSGGLISVAIIIILAKYKKNSYASISVSAAVAHNLGQFAIVTLIMSTAGLIFYLPVLIISGIVTGLITGSLAKKLGDIRKH